MKFGGASVPPLLLSSDSSSSLGEEQHRCWLYQPGNGAESTASIPAVGDLGPCLRKAGAPCQIQKPPTTILDAAFGNPLVCCRLRRRRGRRPRVECRLRRRRGRGRLFGAAFGGIAAAFWMPPAAASRFQADGSAVPAAASRPWAAEVPPSAATRCRNEQAKRARFRSRFLI